MEIKEVDFTSIKGLIKTFNENTDNELEVRLLNKNNKNSKNMSLDHTTFERVRNYLIFDKGDGGLGLKYEVETTLDIKNNEDDVRLTITGKDNIKKFWLMNSLDGINYDVIKKTRIKNVDLIDYNTRIGLSSEKILTKETKDVKSNINTLTNDNKNKTYRLKNRYYIYDETGNFRFDLTAIRMEDNTTFLKSNVMNKSFSYEIELELLKNNATDEEVVIKSAKTSKSVKSAKTSKSVKSVKSVKKSKNENEKENDDEKENEMDGGGEDKVNTISHKLIYYTSLLLSLIQDFTVITKNTDIDEVIISYVSTTGHKGNNKKYRGNKYENVYNAKFIAANPVTIHPINLIKSSSTINIQEPYAITPKADGVRYLLYVAKSSNKDINGRIYMIDIGLNVKFTGYRTTPWAGSIFEGEFISDTNSIYIYDTLFEKGNDVRGRKFNRSITTKTQSTTKSRVEHLDEFLKDDMEHIIDTQNKLIITKKHIEYSNGDNVFQKSNELWNKKGTYDFDIDGLIYIPLNDHYPVRGGSWHSLLKWKPPEYNSIDFLVRTLKTDSGVEVIKPYVSGDKVMRYKTAILYVGSNKDQFNNISKKWVKNIGPTEFNPTGAKGEDVNKHNRAKVFVNDQNIMLFADPINNQQYQLTDDTIVEFYYKDGEWVPLRVRHDKTNQYKQGEKVFGNFESTANDIWKSIINPVTTKMICEGDIDESKINIVTEDIETNKSYYKCVEDGDYNHKKRLPMQNFHNLYVKKTLIMDYSPNSKGSGQSGRLLDLACGKSGDLSKWKNAKLKDIIAIDISKPCVEYGKDFYKTYPKPKPTVRYIWGDTSKAIWPEQEAGQSTMDKERMKEWIPDKNAFDVVSCQFCLHYYFENEAKLKTLIKNVADNIKIGGHFIGTCFNGKNVFNMLKGKKFAEGELDGNTIWKIEKDFKIRSFNEGKPNLGQKIKVYVGSIGEAYTEYLVNFSYFEKMMKKSGFELVEYKPFEKYYVDFEKNKAKNIKEMSDAEKEFSYLNNSFCFKRVDI